MDQDEDDISVALALSASLSSMPPQAARTGPEDWVEDAMLAAALRISCSMLPVEFDARRTQCDDALARALEDTATTQQGSREEQLRTDAALAAAFAESPACRRRAPPFAFHHTAYDAYDDDDAEAPPGDSYEELLALDERIVKVGMAAAEIDQHSVVQTLRATDSIVGSQCIVCLAEYEAGEEVRRLECLCLFHMACIDRHLRENTACPVCRLELTP